MYVRPAIRAVYVVAVRLTGRPGDDGQETSLVSQSARSSGPAASGPKMAGDTRHGEAIEQLRDHQRSRAVIDEYRSLLASLTELLAQVSARAVQRHFGHGTPDRLIRPARPPLS